jgi:hypothetical protein
MIPLPRIVQGRIGILRSLGKHFGLWATQRAIFFADHVDKPTDNKSSRCFATATDAHPHADGNSDQSLIGPDAPLRLGPRHVAPPKLQPVELVMDCPVCTANAEQIATAIDGMGIICPTCGEYDVSSSVLAAEAWQRLDLDKRCDVLNDAKRSGQPGARPTITNELLAAYMEPADEPAALPAD